MVAFLLRAALTGLALWVVTLFVPGLTFVGGNTTFQRIGIIFVVAVLFGVVNAIVKPIVQILSIPMYILTLGLFHIVINAFMLWITAQITKDTTHWGTRSPRWSTRNTADRPLLVDGDLGRDPFVDR